MTGPPAILEGLKVLDVASFIAAPVATTMMADFGAEVVKVESPSGDPYRFINENPGMPVADVDFHWQVDNRNKKGIALNLTNEAGRRALRRLVERADVFVTNFTRPARAKLGLRWEDLRALNDRLIYASLTAYGEEGSEAAKPGFDSTAYWARTGLMHMVKPDPVGTPARSLPGQGDHPTGVALFGAIMLALYDRQRTGKGTKVHTSLIANGLWSNAFFAQAILSGGTAPMRPRREEMPNALTNHYQCRDGRWFILSVVQQDREWDGFVKAVDREELATDPRFATRDGRNAHARELRVILDETFASRDWSHWRKVLDAARITFGVVGLTEDIPHDEQMHACGSLAPSADPNIGAGFVIDTPLWVEGATKRAPTAAPTTGQHTVEVLAAAGFTQAEIGTLESEGAFSA